MKFLNRPTLRKSGVFIILLLSLALFSGCNADDVSEEVNVQYWLSSWVKSQNSGDFKAYSSLYSNDFKGIKRVGKFEKTYNQQQWLDDRGRMFKKPFYVAVSTVNVTINETLRDVTFIQTWESETFKDIGKKRLILRPTDTKYEIVSEEMLFSRVLRRNKVDVFSPSNEMLFTIRVGDDYYAVLDKIQNYYPNDDLIKTNGLSIHNSMASLWFLPVSENVKDRYTTNSLDLIAVDSSGKTYPIDVGSIYVAGIFTKHFMGAGHDPDGYVLAKLPKKSAPLNVVFTSTGDVEWIPNNPNSSHSQDSLVNALSEPLDQVDGASWVIGGQNEFQLTESQTLVVMTLERDVHPGMHESQITLLGMLDSSGRVQSVIKSNRSILDPILFLRDGELFLESRSSWPTYDKYLYSVTLTSDQIALKDESSLVFKYFDCPY
jgi:hypothetical protein